MQDATAVKAIRVDTQPGVWL